MQDFIDFHGKGFWLDGFELNIWIRLFCHEVLHNNSLAAPPWLREACIAWKTESQRWGNMLELELDKWVTCQDRCNQMVSTSLKIVDIYRKINTAENHAVIYNFLSSDLGVPHLIFDPDGILLTLKYVLQTGQAICELLEGQVPYDLIHHQGFLGPQGIVPIPPSP